MINCKLEGLNRCTCYALVVPNLESRKCISVVDLDFDYDSQQTLKCTAKEVEIQDLPPPLDNYDQTLPPHDGSRVSGESTYHVAYGMESTLVSVEYMLRYLMAEEKLRKHLKLITLEDHQWYLRSSDHNMWVQ